jgi:hypothetical protein
LEIEAGDMDEPEKMNTGDRLLRGATGKENLNKKDSSFLNKSRLAMVA